MLLFFLMVFETEASDLFSLLYNEEGNGCVVDLVWITYVGNK